MLMLTIHQQVKKVNPKKNQVQSWPVTFDSFNQAYLTKKSKPKQNGVKFKVTPMCWSAGPWRQDSETSKLDGQLYHCQVSTWCRPHGIWAWKRNLAVPQSFWEMSCCGCQLQVVGRCAFGPTSEICSILNNFL